MFVTTSILKIFCFNKNDLFINESNSNRKSDRNQSPTGTPKPFLDLFKKFQLCS